MAKGKNIPIGSAKQLSQQYNYDKVIIIGINETEDNIQFGITTYGKNKKLCKEAANLGQNYFKHCLEKYYGTNVEEEK